MLFKLQQAPNFVYLSCVLGLCDPELLNIGHFTFSRSKISESRQFIHGDMVTFIVGDGFKITL